MKIKITILTENDIPASALNGIDEEQIKSAWQSFLDLISVMPTENNDKATVLSAEFVEEEGEAVLPSAHSEIEERKEESAQNVPKEDLISRKAAIDAALSAFSRGLLASPDIRRLPSAQPEPQWIPVSERLPEKFGNYLISIHGEDEPDIGTISPNDKRGWSLCDARGFHWASDQKLIITAWMPLPDPYRAERRTDE